MIKIQKFKKGTETNSEQRAVEGHRAQSPSQRQTQRGGGETAQRQPRNAIRQSLRTHPHRDPKRRRDAKMDRKWTALRLMRAVESEDISSLSRLAQRERESQRVPLRLADGGASPSRADRKMIANHRKSAPSRRGRAQTQKHRDRESKTAQSSRKHSADSSHFATESQGMGSL